MMVPFGAIDGFSLSGEIREVAAHYGVDHRALRRSDGRQGEVIALARHALFWKLTTQRKLSPARVARLLSCSKSAVRGGVAEHVKRIEEFRITTGLRT